MSNEDTKKLFEEFGRLDAKFDGIKEKVDSIEEDVRKMNEQMVTDRLELAKYSSRTSILWTLLASGGVYVLKSVFTQVVAMLK